MITKAMCLLLLAGACGSSGNVMVDATPPPDGAPTLDLTLARGATLGEVAVTLHSVGATPTLTITGGTATTPVATGADVYTATVTATALDSEVRIDAAAGALHATRTALVFATLDARVGQPELLPGLVNTPGWEDGANVSPDGQWLIVASYLPLDALSCSLASLDPTDPTCATIIGPYAAPERPGMLGAARIANGTFANDCPDVGLTTPPADFTFMPTAGFGFHRQADGSFAEPFVIGFDADGCLGPYGYSFTGAPSGLSAGVVFAESDPLVSGATARLTYAPLTLGSPNILGTYRVVNGALAVSGFTATVLPPMLATRQGNPSFGGGRLYWDDEDLANPDRDLYFADVTGTLPAITAGPAKTVGVSLPGVDEIQPAIDGDDLYWMSGGTLYTATLTPGADAALPASWSPRVALLGVASAGAIVATGEPTVAHVDGATELYFVYIKRTATGFDGNVGRASLGLSLNPGPSPAQRGAPTRRRDEGVGSLPTTEEQRTRRGPRPAWRREEFEDRP